jgi:hypothetical protein
VRQDISKRTGLINYVAQLENETNTEFVAKRSEEIKNTGYTMLSLAVHDSPEKLRER